MRPQTLSLSSSMTYQHMFAICNTACATNEAVTVYPVISGIRAD